MTLLHATAVAGWTPLGWRAVLLCGPSASGKSDVALRLLARGWRLIGDDYVQAWASGGAAYVAAPDRLAGVLEVRGVGLIGAETLELARVALMFDCQAAVDRLPEPAEAMVAGVAVRRFALSALEPSAPDKVAAALLSRDMASRLEP